MHSFLFALFFTTTIFFVQGQENERTPINSLDESFTYHNNVDSIFEQLDSCSICSEKEISRLIKVWGEYKIQGITLTTFENKRLFKIYPKLVNDYFIRVLFSRNELIGIIEGNTYKDTDFFEKHYYKKGQYMGSIYTQRGMRIGENDENEAFERAIVLVNQK
tara:strand:- start:69 stop:554 length:486 start_codon:yes stop_codon:yes gene_type:complete